MAGGPRPLPGTAIGSLLDGAVLVSVVAPSEGSGAIMPAGVEAGEPLLVVVVPVEVPVAASPRIGEGPVPGASVVASEPVLGGGAIVGVVDGAESPVTTKKDVSLVGGATVVGDEEVLVATVVVVAVVVADVVTVVAV